MKNVIKKIKGLSKKRQIIFGLIFLLGLIYLVWCLIPHTKPNTEVFVPTKSITKVAKQTGPIMTVPLKIIPKKVIKKINPNENSSETEEYIDTAKIPISPEGGKTITRIDTTTGNTITEFKADKAPWFAFENKNYIGGGYEIGTEGRRIDVYYKRDMLRIKDIHIQGKVEGKLPMDGNGKTEGTAGVFMEWRW